MSGNPRPAGPGRYGWTDEEVLLVSAALDGPEAARRSWAALRPAFDVDALSGDVYRLAPLAGWNLERAGVSPTDDPVVRRLLGITRRTWVQSHRQLATAGDVAELLGSVGVRVTLLKGAALLLLAYPELGLRPMEDLDLLIHPRDRDVAARALAAAGYRPLVRSKADHAESWAGPGGIELDLHWQPNPWLVQPAAAPGPAAMRGGAVAVTLPDGRPATVATTADQLLVVLVHGIRPYSARLRWVADATWLVRSGAVDWERFVTQARRFDVSCLALRAIESLEAVRGSAVVPHHVAAALRANPRSPVDRLTVLAMDRERFPNACRALLYHLREVPPGSRLRALPHVAGGWLGTDSAPQTARALVRRGPAYARRLLSG